MQAVSSPSHHEKKRENVVVREFIGFPPLNAN